MRLHPSRPITIHAVSHAQRWFPFLYQHTDGSLLLSIQCGYDADFAPRGRWRSVDGGATWFEEEENLPRGDFVHFLPDSTLFEMDAYGFLDPATPDTFCYYGAWSVPGHVKPEGVGHSAWYHDAGFRGETWLADGEEGHRGSVRRAIVRLHSPSIQPASLTRYQGAYPNHPWWSLINRLHSPTVNGEDILMGGPYLTDSVQCGERLLAVGYGVHREARTSVFCYESKDRGLHWQEIGVVARGSDSTPEGFNESTLTRLKDGRLYSAIRSGDLLHHAWSSDDGKSWSSPIPIRPIDSDVKPRMVWPRVAKLGNGTLVLAYGRPGKHLLFDPSGTGEQWQGHLDLQQWELSTQELMGVPEDQRLRGDTGQCVRYWDSGDYLSVVAVGERELLVTYDVQNYVEHRNAIPFNGVRLIRVHLGLE